MVNTIAWISAHPDDETFLGACTMMEAVRRGWRNALLVATAGEASKSVQILSISPEEMARRRKEEMMTAGKILGISCIRFLQYPDKGLAAADFSSLVEEITQFLSEQQAKVVITFGEDGMSGHPDHIALHYAVKEAVLSGRCPTVQKLYYYHNPADKMKNPSVRLDTRPCWETKVKALLAHETQIPAIERVFGNIRRKPSSPPPSFIFESFVLAWERGTLFPSKTEEFVTDGLD